MLLLCLFMIGRHCRQNTRRWMLLVAESKFCDWQKVCTTPYSPAFRSRGGEGPIRGRALRTRPCLPWGWDRFASRRTRTRSPPAACRARWKSSCGTTRWRWRRPGTSAALWGRWWWCRRWPSCSVGWDRGGLGLHRHSHGFNRAERCHGEKSRKKSICLRIWFFSSFPAPEGPEIMDEMFAQGGREHQMIEAANIKISKRNVSVNFST